MTLLLALVPATVLGADSKPPEKMAFQGFLTDQNGVARGQSSPVNLVVTFRLYKTATAAANQAVWSEQQTVTVDKGHFSVVLGDGVLQSGSATFSTHFSGNDTDAGRYLGVTVSGEAEISPRIQFFTAPYASLARYATELVGTSGSSVLKVGVGTVGINLAGAPSSALDVNGTVTATGLNVNGTSTFNGQVNGTSFNGAHTGDGSALTGLAKLSGGNTFSGSQSVVGSVRVDANNANTGVLFGAPSLLFGPSNTGEGISSKRTSGGNSGGLDLYTGYSARLSITSTGNVGVGLTDPSSRLHVNGSVAIQNNSVLQFGQGFTRETSAGQIGYGTHSGGASGSLDIVGAGTTSSNRKISMWAEGGAQLNGWLRVGGFVNQNVGTFAYYARTLNPGVPPFVQPFYQTATGVSSGTVDYSIVAERRIAASEFNAYSDARIKQVVGTSDSKRNLEKVLQLRPTEYRMLDVVNEGTDLHLGFIAQEVTRVIPEAVHASKQFIPDLYCVATTVTFNPTNKTLTLGLPKAHSLAKGDRVRIIGHLGPVEFTVQETPKADTLVLGGCEVAYKEVFLFGKEVPDFLSVNYDHIFTTTVGAVQELAHRLAKQDAELAELRGELAKARGEKQSLAENLSAMDARLVRLEKVLKQQAALSPARADAELVQVSNPKGPAALVK